MWRKEWTEMTKNGSSKMENGSYNVYHRYSCYRHIVPQDWRPRCLVLAIVNVWILQNDSQVQDIGMRK